MFRYNRVSFIFFNFILSFICFLIIFSLRYSTFFDFGEERRILDLYTLLLFGFYSFIIVIFNISFKIYELNKVSRFVESFLSNFFIAVISMGFFGIYFYFTQTNFARFVFFTGFLLIPFITSIFNKIFFILISKKKHPYRILFVGSSYNYKLFKNLIKEYSKLFYINIDKVFKDDSSKLLLQKKIKCDFMVVDTDQTFNKNFTSILNNYEIEGGKIYSLIDIFSYLDQSLPAEIIKNKNYDLFTSFKLDSIYNFLIKRIGDIFISFCFIILLSPIILLTCILIKLTSQGKIFYKQKRVTLKNKEFIMYKFRSMHELAENGKPQLTKKNDSRITFIGKIIRPLRIDEIPQLFNILLGDMSFIGPRPERSELINEIIKKYPLFKKRSLVKPGLTGWAQVKYKYVNHINSMNKKLSYDLYYLNNISFVFDLKILLYTIETIIFRRGAL